MFAIKRMRERARMKQQDVADALGVKKSRYGDWERETTMINLRDAIRLAELFGCTLDELANHDVERPISLEERAIIDTYRAADDRGKSHIVTTVEMEARYMDEASLKNAEGYQARVG